MAMAVLWARAVAAIWQSEELISEDWRDVLRPSQPRIHSYCCMNDDAKRIVRRALEEAQAAGKDYLEQTEAAVRALHRELDRALSQALELFDEQAGGDPAAS